jgi:hypothetical protein
VQELFCSYCETENTHIAIFDTQSGNFNPWIVAPWAGTHSFPIHDSAPGSATVLFASNRRDRSTFDLYKTDVATRQIEEVARRDGSVLTWTAGTDGNLAGRIRQLGKTMEPPGV